MVRRLTSRREFEDDFFSNLIITKQIFLWPSNLFHNPTDHFYSIFQKEREKTKGANWFNMKAPEVTEELKNDIQILQMRSALDPKKFYKRNEMKTIPKYFEVKRFTDNMKQSFMTYDFYFLDGSSHWITYWISQQQEYPQD